MAEVQVQRQTQKHHDNNRYQRRGKGTEAVGRPADTFTDNGTLSSVCVLPESHGSEPEPLGVRRSHHQQQWEVTGQLAVSDR